LDSPYEYHLIYTTVGIPYHYKVPFYDSAHEVFLMNVYKKRSFPPAACLAALVVLVLGSCTPMEPGPGLFDAFRDLTGSLPVFPGACCWSSSKGSPS